MSEIGALACMCQECGFAFSVSRLMTNIINLDTDEKATNEFLNMNLNTVECPNCHKIFTYEIPMLVISAKHGYAIKVNPSSFGLNTPGYPCPRHIISKDFKLREVNFLIEALEKHLIFSSGNDDIEIELIKKLCFSDSETLPFDHINMIFQKRSGNNFYFTKFNCTNDIIGTYHKCTDNLKLPEISKTKEEKTWQIVNRLTINNYIGDCKINSKND